RFSSSASVIAIYKPLERIYLSNMTDTLCAQDPSDAGHQPLAADFGLLAPYLERPCILFATPAASSVPLMIWYLTPGRSLTLPPLMSTTLCSCRLWPIPGIYAVTSIPLVRRTLATFLRAELGFLGVTVLTTVHTPLFWGDLVSTGLFFVELYTLFSAGAGGFYLTTSLSFLTI